jgi:hypothetical protein
MRKSTFFFTIALVCVVVSGILNFSGWIANFEVVTYLMAVYGLMLVGVLAFMVGFEYKVNSKKYN